MIKPTIGTRVRLTSLASGAVITGKICGSGHFINDHDELTECFIVRLDEGFYDERKQTYVTKLVAHTESVEVMP
jgi:hypothetical protein